MKRANLHELEEQTMARFLSGLNHPIKKIVDFQNMIELLHQASKAERHVQEDFAYNKNKAPYVPRYNSASIPTNTQVPTTNFSKTPMKQMTKPQLKSPLPKAGTSSKESTGKSLIICFKCGGKGHKSFECVNTKVMLTMRMEIVRQ